MPKTLEETFEILGYFDEVYNEELKCIGTTPIQDRPTGKHLERRTVELAPGARLVFDRAHKGTEERLFKKGATLFFVTQVAQGRMKVPLSDWNDPCHPRFKKGL